ncbi:MULTISPECIES: glucose-1-phosphate thymidylyltransferase [unclassified Synechocystis]|uniref:glucose-1-phosphate thymidylyltransferase n=1 Tax=unclassified Synechocystis TaxID=2640012 RepID=UPI00040F4A5A|nr:MULTISPECIES: glucose-1-phosphate thymidylyltransferase [unclassified Synechocystis]AIE73059.1 Glucose-1-phosphate thymidylyltransferase [Synechocystis sp. PCC 6714]MCT0254409.1 glucose-1-phosphate thymidylyltransferase [Synechocystis sp. CS-94]
MKALILSGGKGTRLRPLTYTGAKQLVPVANKPILWYGIEAIAKAGIKDIGIIISPETGEEIKSVTGSGEKFNAQITYILQSEPLGLAHAVKTAADFLQDSPFVMYLGDNLIEDDLAHFLSHFQSKSLDSLILLQQVPNPAAFGVATVDNRGKVLALVEKPEHPPSNLALVGLYFFAPTIHQAIANIEPSGRGELEITDAIQYLISHGYGVESLQLEGWWLDTGKKDDLLAANQIILDSLVKKSIQGTVDHQSKISGRVTIGPHSQIINSVIRGPVAIGSHCHLENCFIGPYSSIADSVIIRDADLEHSVVLQGASIVAIQQRIVDSVVGKNARISPAPRRPQALRFLIGNDSQVELIGPPS